MNAMKQPLTLCRWSLLALIALQLLWFGWLHPPQRISMAAALTLTTAPLVILLPLVWRLRPRPLVVAGLVLLIYFSVGVMEAWANPAVRLPALLQVALVLVYFTALATIRRRPPPDASAD